MKYEIDIEDLKEGYEPIAWRVPRMGESYTNNTWICKCKKVMKIPRLIVKKNVKVRKVEK